MNSVAHQDLFVFDLDGTLVHSLGSGERGIPHTLKDIVHEISKRASIAVATGRRYRSSLPEIQNLPTMPYSVHNNGLVIKDQRGKTVFRRELPAVTARSICEVLENELVDYFLVTDGHDEGVDYVFISEVLARSESCQKVLERTQGHNRIIKNLSAIETFNEVPFVEVASLGQSSMLLKQREKIAAKLPPSYRSIVVRNIGFADWGALEIFPTDISKWSGVEFVKQKLKSMRIIAVGDDENDIEMIKYADIGVVMSHAESHVRAVGSIEAKGFEGLTLFLKEFYSS